ncbi:MAG: response regulator, partial [Pyrinomonadaceae bacterium]
CGDSLDLCRQLRQSAPATPIIFYSALGFPSDIRNGLEAGANAYLVKPYSGDLAETILQTIQSTKMSYAPVLSAAG